MKILIDVQAVQSGSSKGGIGRYVLSLLEAMVRNNTNHELLLLINANLPMHNYAKLTKLIPQENIYSFYSEEDIRECFLQHHILSEASKLTKEYVVSLINPDIFFVTSLFEGLNENVITSVGEIFPSHRTVTILYDLIPLMEYQRYLLTPIVHKHYMSKIFYLIQSGLILSISHYSKLEGSRILKIPDHKIINISSAIDPMFRPIKVSSKDKEAIYKKFKIKNKFLLFTGSYDIRKNQHTLIKAFAMLPKKLRQEYQLLIVGSGSPSTLKEFQSTVKKVGLKKDDVIFAGFVDDADLLHLYNLTSLFVFPTLREGFGLPALEAMSCGAPTIGSNTTSISEVINKADALFDPTDTNSLYKKIEQVLTNPSFAKELKEHGLKQSKNFSWDKTAHIALQAMQNHYESLKEIEYLPHKNLYDTLLHKISLIEDIAQSKENERIRIANSIAKNHIQIKKKLQRQIGIISTWNTRCGIASYIRYLSQSFIDQSIVLAPFADEPEMVTKDENFVIRSWWRETDTLDLLFEQIINLELKSIFIQFNFAFFNLSHLNEFIKKCVQHNIRVSITFHSTKDHPLREDKKLSILQESLKLCKNIFVHTLGDIRNLQNLQLQDNVTLFKQGVIDAPPLPVANKDKIFTLATYGFFLEHKGFLDMIEAFINSPKPIPISSL